MIDDDPETYTVDRLRKMKLEHEESVTALSGEQAELGVALLLDQSVSAINQAGGINAHTVNIHVNQPAPPDSADSTTGMSDRPTPNLIFTGADIAPLAEIGSGIWSRDMGRFERQWAIENGQVALLAQFTNEARIATQNVGGPVKAQLVYGGQTGEFRRIAGCWLEESTDYANFRVDETHELLIAVKARDRINTIGKRRITVALNTEQIESKTEPMPVISEGTVRIRLTHASTGDFLFEREFRFKLNPFELS